MASTLKLVYNHEGLSPVLDEVLIDDVALDNPINVTQQLINGELRATIEAVFTTVTTEEAAPVTAPVLGATFVAAASPDVGLVLTVTDIPEGSNTLGYAINASATTAPNVGAVAPSLTPITGATATITGVTAGQYISVYEITLNTNTVVKFVDHLVIAAEIGVNAPALSGVTFAAAETPSTGTVITVPTASSGNSYVYTYQAAAAPTPNVGEASPSGATAISGTTATVANAEVDNYITVYEVVTDGSTVVSFVNHIITSGEVGTGE